MSEGVLKTELPGLELWARGKVRDVYDLGEHLLMVSTDRISAFDSILPTPIPGKGEVLTQLSCFWFEFLNDVVPNHLVTADVTKMGHDLDKYAEKLAGRSMLCKKASVFPIECVARGYLMGTGWKDYQKTQQICGIDLPRGLQLGSKLPEVIFTPATKNNSGHDENITFDFAVARTVEFLGVSLETARKHMERLKELTIAIYEKARDHADERGIILADTKLEFGLLDGEIILVDEVLTPDSSRFWPKDKWTPGQQQQSFDKQFIRDYLEAVGWDKEPPAPELPDKVVAKSTEKYREAYKRITGKELG